MSDVLDETLEVIVRKQKYIFKIPSITFDIEVGYRATEIRQRIAPQFMGSLFGLDNAAAQLARNFAVMELYLLRADVPWPFSPGPNGKPVVDSAKFPRDKTNTVYDIGQAFEAAYGRFRDDGTGDNQSNGDQAVAGVEDPGAP